MGDYYLLRDDPEVADLCSGLGNVMGTLEIFEEGVTAQFDGISMRF
jgi:hypothetical protein